jgi:hypothetical protein
MIPESHLQGVLDIWGQSGELSVCPIEGNCMSPMIREGDTLIIQHGSDGIRVGDVVVFGSPGSFHVHRVLGIKGGDGSETFLLKGDQNPMYNNPVPMAEILGKVIEVRGSNGYLRLESSFWKNLNYLLSIRSNFAARRNAADTIFWKTVNVLHGFTSKIIPKRFSIGRPTWRATCLVYRMLNFQRISGIVKRIGE